MTINIHYTFNIYLVKHKDAKFTIVLEYLNPTLRQHAYVATKDSGKVGINGGFLIPCGFEVLAEASSGGIPGDFVVE